MKNREKLLFEHYRDNLNSLLASDSRLQMKPQRNDIVVCPLCFNRYFTTDSFSNKELTLEHAPPEKVGGTVVALTCSTCNRVHGSTLDKHLVRFVQNLDALSGAGSTYVDAYAKAEDREEFRTQFRVTDENKFELLGIPNPRASNRKHVEEFTAGFQSQEFKFKLRLHLGNDWRAKLSLLRSAYLIAFQHLGYGFLINLNLGRVRYQLNNPDENIFPKDAIRFPIDLSDEYIGINIIKKPVELKCYFVVFDIQAKDGICRRVGVMLPGPNSHDYSMFEKLDGNSQLELAGKHFDIKFETKIESPRLADIIWNEV